MGYNFYITRAPDWFDNAESRIALEDWLSYVASDPEMRLDNFAEADTSDGTLRSENVGLVVWTAYSHHDSAGNMAWFDYQNGNIVVKNPDEEIIAKLLRIAASLAARVQGDEGEFYSESLQRYLSPSRAFDRKNKPWWKRLLSR